MSEQMNRLMQNNLLPGGVGCGEVKDH